MPKSYLHLHRLGLLLAVALAGPARAAGDAGGVLGNTAWETLNRGGAIMFVILGVSIVGLGFVLDAAWRTRRRAILASDLVARLRNSDGCAALDELLSCPRPTPLHLIIAAGHRWRHGTQAQIQGAIEEAVDQLLWRFKRSVKPLGIIANTAPLLGLLGTVIGIVQAFDVVARQGALGDPGKLAGGISKALLTTCFGLIVAIPMLLMYHYFTGKIEGLLKSAEELAKEALILPPEAGPAAAAAELEEPVGSTGTHA